MRGSFVGLIALAALGLLVLCVFSASATITGDSPPSSGEWIIKNPTTVRDETILINGNITVEGSLSVYDSTIRLNPSSGDEYVLKIDRRGSLSAADSRFAPLNTSNDYEFLVLGELTLDRTVLEGCRLGLHVRSNEQVVVRNCTVLNPTGKGLYLEYANNTLIEDMTLMLNNMTAFRLDETVLSNNFDVTITTAAIHISGGKPVLRTIDVYLNGNMTGEVRMMKEDRYGRIYIRWHHHMLLIDSESNADVSGLDIRNGTVNFHINYYLDNNYTSMGYWYTRGYYYAYAITVPSYRSVTLRALSLDNVGLGTHTTNSVYSGLPYNSHYMYNYPQTMKFIEAILREGFTDSGPHRYSLTI
ncbi:MAG: right-handed parallel beta-helix repeat-containing protein, partial [Thermoplasmata archaeon]|nr:right-handed parallel beta-helix repeat-containing protein [Thermoplasmata archaeon]